jgi:tRNA threonylcarbamoyladenosine biosynthesis protein TsaB
MVLAIKTAGEVSEIYLLADAAKPVKRKTWSAGRNLAHDLPSELEQLVGGDWSQLSGLVVYSGPGSFTGLRIGITVMNTLGYSLNVPIVGTSGDDWLEAGWQRLSRGQNDHLVTPNYGGEPQITQPKK